MESNNKFSWKTFFGFPTYLEQYTYAIKTLDLLGSGTGREVFDLGPTRVLKMAKLNSNNNIIPSGLEQNKEEIKIAAEFPLLTPKILKSSSNSYWMIVEKAKPIDTIEKFKELSGGISFNMLGFAIMYFDNLRHEPDEKQIELQLKRRLGYYPYRALGYETEEEMETAIVDLLQNNFFKQLLVAISKHEIMSGDLTKLDSWGLALESRRVVVMDMGLTKTSYNVYRNDIEKDLLDEDSDEQEEPNKNKDNLFFEFLVYT